MGKNRRLRQAKKSEDKWSRVDLPPPPQFNGTNFSTWTSRMRVYLRYADTLVDSNDEAKDALALHLIQRVVDDRLMQKIATVKTSKEAWKILEAQFSVRGSCHEEADEEDDEVVIEASASEVEHDQEACREAHCAEPQVDDADEDGAAIAAVDDKLATREVAGQPFQAKSETEIEAATAAEVEEEQLTKSLPMRAIVFSNSDLDCECAGIARISLQLKALHRKTVENNEEKTIETKYDEEFLSSEEKQKLKNEISLIADLLNGKIAETNNSAENNTEHVKNKQEEAEDCRDNVEIKEFEGI